MPLKTPAFWTDRNVISTALRPFSCAYRLGHKIKMALARPYKSAIPVLCVGGIVAGGSGKTPIVHAVVDLIREQGIFENPVILTRGYGGSLKGPTLVDLSVHSAEGVGDEALLHASRAPTVVARNRSQGAMLAEAMNADIIVMDDGFQNHSLEKSLSFLVIDSSQGLGNGYCLPAGPLREPLEEALRRCALVIRTGGESNFPVLEKPAAKAVLHIVSSNDHGKSYVAFAGLGHPEKFRRTLEEDGFKIARFVPFADHHPYSRADMATLKADGLPLITTEKDFMRIPADDRSGIDVVRISYSFETPQTVIDHLKRLCP
ncbi:MAG TPA: tetraacyldisaccharide 4'-kinase [Micavibrio sp.]|nr:tetraacyldisaccharide 4'-kinase [Micavibrio sp.]